MRHLLLPRSFVLVLVLVPVLVLAAAALAQDDADDPQPPVPAPATTKPKTETNTEAATSKPAASALENGPLEFGTSLSTARAAAKAESKPLLVVCIPDWYASPAWARLRAGVLADAAKAAPLGAFVRVLIEETRDREVHVRHRVAFDGYPLAVVLGTDGAYLGHVSGTPSGDDGAAWTTSVAAIPARARRIAELRERLVAAPEDATVLFELGKALSDAGEHERAAAVFERMERADPLAPAARLGEARYLRLRHDVVDLLTAKKFGDVEGLCLRWLRRFSEHARAADVLLLQANARFLASHAPEARVIWQRLVDDHEGTAAAETAAQALADLID